MEGGSQEGGREGNRKKKKANRKGRQKLLGVQAQACTIQPLWILSFWVPQLLYLPVPGTRGLQKQL